jgi:Na+-translocating ferredoxin:NAD+ oxidoreductase RnfC subunit
MPSSRCSCVCPGGRPLFDYVIRNNRELKNLIDPEKIKGFMPTAPTPGKKCKTVYRKALKTGYMKRVTEILR